MPHIELGHKKGQHIDKDGKALCKLMNKPYAEKQWKT